MLVRVIDAVTFDQPQGMRTLYVAEYLSRASKVEFASLMRGVRRPRRRARGVRTKH